MTPENVIEQWANYFNAGDLEGITSLYHRDSHSIAYLSS